MYAFIFISILISNSYCLSNSEKKIDEIMNGNYSLEEISLINSEPESIYLKGLTEIDGEKSKDFFLEYYNKYSNNKYSASAVVKIAEYFYAKGSYVQAAHWYQKIPIKYPNSDYVDKSISYHLNSLVISGQVDSAKYYTKVFKKKFPKLKFNYDFIPTNKISNKPLVDSKSSSISNGFTIQVGIFKQYRSALYKKKILMSEGFASNIKEVFIDNQKLYSLRLGSFKKRSNAEKEALRLKSRTGIYNSIIIEL